MKKIIKVLNLLNKNNIKYDLETDPDKNIFIYLKNYSLFLDKYDSYNIYIQYTDKESYASKRIKYNELYLLIILK